MVTVGVLALQGAYARHLEAFRSIGAEAVAVRTPAHLGGVDALVVPGGESTTMSLQLERGGLFEPIRERLGAGMPAFGTCAGAILLGRSILDGRDDQRAFGAIDLVVRRNGYGRQIDSFERPLQVAALGEPPVTAVFIRAPVVEEVGPDVEILAAVDGRPVLCRTPNIVVCTFHPELGDDTRVHRLFLDAVSR